MEDFMASLHERIVVLKDEDVGSVLKTKMPKRGDFCLDIMPRVYFFSSLETLKKRHQNVGVCLETERLQAYYGKNVRGRRFLADKLNDHDALQEGTEEW
eukprot:CAMPEP_0170168070 /NCGR_PEP_ID=MMETSP0040_2-20121228/1257_1 /TAXON_ID=641309 /ORGANISM="Lotharella oceanica, Strain CCMP622" /LENGTH=98 /DNA_ID=CAMNT_0010406247 /DNA_START=123 /DNA_END=416 /DNA_ORIENTATION=+